MLSIFRAKPVMGVINTLKNKERELVIQNARLRRDLWDKDKVISYLLRRPHLESGSLEMAEGDAMCEKFGVRPWKPPGV